MTPKGPAKSSRLRTSAAGVLLYALPLVGYIPAYRAGFIWDDDSYVTQNETLRSLDGLRRIWLAPGTLAQYYPLVHTSLWAEYHLWGLQPAVYHVLNVLLHATSSVLVWRLLARLGLRWGWLIAAVFAVHPVHVESVAWVTERKNVLSGVFYLLAMRAYLCYRPLVVPPGECPHSRRTFYVLALLAFSAAMLSKTVSCSLPAALLLLVWWKCGRLAWRDVRPLIPFFVVGLGLSVLTVKLEARMVQETSADWNLSVLQRLLIFGRAPWFYLGKLIYPVNLSFIYPKWTLDVRAGWQYLFLGATLALIVGLWLARRRLGRGPLVAVLFFGGTLVPALGLIDLYPMRYSFVADHFQYLASLGVIALVISGVAGAVARLHPAGARAVLPLGVAGLAALGVMTWRQTCVYQDLEILWRDVLAKNPTAFIALNNLGIYLAQQDRTAEAIPFFERGLMARPDDVNLCTNLANAYGKLGRLDDALAMYARVLARGSANAATHYNAGITYARAQRYDEARAHLARALELNPASPSIRQTLARVLILQGDAQARAGRIPEAAACYREGLSIQPDLPEARAALSRLGSR